jgi:hypothetical protein
MTTFILVLLAVNALWLLLRLDVMFAWGYRKGFKAGWLDCLEAEEERKEKAWAKWREEQKAKPQPV